jgi:hypothetical protein
MSVVPLLNVDLTTKFFAIKLQSFPSMLMQIFWNNVFLIFVDTLTSDFIVSTLHLNTLIKYFLY